jgi:hypothetical protein
VAHLTDELSLQPTVILQQLKTISYVGADSSSVLLQMSPWWNLNLNAQSEPEHSLPPHTDVREYRRAQNTTSCGITYASVH